MPTTARTLRLERQLRAKLGNTLDQQTRDLVAAWARAWDEVAGDLNDALTLLLTDAVDGHVSRALMLRNRRLQKALAVIAEKLDDLATAAGVRISGDIHGIVDQAGAAQAEIIASQLPDAFDFDLEAWSRVDPAAIDAIVQRTTEQITAAHYPISDDAYDVVRRELVRGVAAGSNPKDTAARMVRRAEKGFNGGLSRAINIARTETVDAHREAARVGQNQHADVLAGWIWLAELTPRTCPACLAMHGREFPLDEAGPHGHQQCRCSRTPKTLSWADLGIDLDEPADAIPDADAFFVHLSPEEQRQILGPERYRAWVQGDFPREEWAKRRSNDGWRDSVVPARPGETGAGGAGGKPPNKPAAPPSPDDGGDDLPPIGPVLGTPDQQRYLRAGEPPPADFNIDANANFAWTFIPDPDDRATAMMMYDNAGEYLVKTAARAMHDGTGPPDLWETRLALYWRILANQLESGVDLDTYTLEDLRTDVEAAAARVLAWSQTARTLPMIHARGLSIATTLDILDDDELAQFVRLVKLDDMWLASAAPSAVIARHYAMSGPGVPAMLVFLDAYGFRLSQVGRMSMHPESLILGDYRLERYYVDDGIVYIEVRRVT